MKSPDAGVFFTLGLGIGSAIGIAVGHIDMGMALGAVVGAAVGGFIKLRNRSLSIGKSNIQPTNHSEK